MVHGDIAALGEESEGDGTADSGCATGDDGCFALEEIGWGHLFLFVVCSFGWLYMTEIGMGGVVLVGADCITAVV